MGKKGERSNFKEVKASKNNRIYTIFIIVVLAFFIVLLGIVFSTREVELKIDEVALETAVKSSLITIAQDEFGKIDKENQKYAEGHKILRSEVNGGKIYAYTVAEYGIYKNKSDEKVSPVSAATKPIVFVFNVEEIESTDSNEKEMKYVFFKSYKVQGEDDESWQESLEILFPVDLVNAVKVDYAEDFYQNQIKAYFVTENTTTEIENKM